MYQRYVVLCTTPIVVQENVSILKMFPVETQASTENTGEPQELKNRVSQRLQRELTSFFNTLLLCLTRTTDR